MEDKKCIQLTGGPLVPDVPLGPDFPPWPWTERVMLHSSDMLVWWKMQSNNNAWGDWVSHTKKICHYYLCPYLITFGSFWSWLSLWSRISLKWSLLFDLNYTDCVWALWHSVYIYTVYIWVPHFERHELDTYRKPWGTSFTSLSIKTYLTLESIFCFSVYKTSLKLVQHYLKTKASNMSFFIFFYFTYKMSRVTWLSSLSSVSRRTLGSDGNKLVEQSSYR